MSTVRSVINHSRTKFRSLLVSSASVLAAGYVCPAAGAEFNIPAQPLANALIEFSRQSDVNVAVPSALVEGKQAPAVRGEMTAGDALAQLLANSGLQALESNRGVVTIQRIAQAAAQPRGGGTANPRRAAAVISAAAAEALEEVIVTGSRIVREGYEAPTPLTVIGADALEQSADANVVSLLSTMPAITGAATASVSASQLGQGNPGLQALNLRSLGSNRVLVLLDGQRTVASHYSNIVDVANFPAQLIQRVDVVTGGASAVYGSDAVAGVVNFILDRSFTGVRGEVSGGMTNHGDDRNYKVNMSAGFPFASGRGHMLVSGEHMHTAGIDGVGGRPEQLDGYLQLVNPAYTPTNGQPSQLFLPHSALAGATGGGIIVAGPLKGTAFGAGGRPYQFQYGSIVSGATMYGGDWKGNDLRPYYDLAPSQTNQSIFTRVGYDLADTVNVFVQWNWSQNRSHQHLFPTWLLGGPTTYVVQIDNAFLPESVRAAMTTHGITSFGIGSWNQDLGSLISSAERMTHRLSGGLEGSFDAFDTSWIWSAHYAYGSTKTSLTNDVPIGARYRLAMDAVVNPATGQIVCRSVLQGAANGCRPWNPMGIGVNDGNEVAAAWMRDDIAYQYGLIEQHTMAVSATGAPFSSWAGPVSVAVSAEHRTDEIHAIADPGSLSGGRIAGNYAPLDGKQSVTEGALETVVPLALDMAWAQAWDLSAAVRFTDYELAGYVTTWKVGTTYAPTEDLKFRITRSRDIRAPNLQDLFAAPSFGTVGAGLIDRFLGNVPAPGNAQQAVGGNINLRPEKADTTGIGIVLSPRFLDGFTMSADYWHVDLKDAIQPMAAQQVIDACYNGLIPALCSNISRNPDGTLRVVEIFPINLATQTVEGVDLETSYRFALSDIAAGWDGALSLHGLMTFYLKNYQDTTFIPATDSAGQNVGTTPPTWKLSVTASYQLDPITVSLTGRAVSSGTINNQYLACTSGCPASTVTLTTINTNDLPGRFYLDASASYRVYGGERFQSDLFVSARNLFNNQMPPLPGVFFYPYGQTGSVYDVVGTVYRAGIRFRM